MIDSGSPLAGGGLVLVCIVDPAVPIQCITSGAQNFSHGTLFFFSSAEGSEVC